MTYNTHQNGHVKLTGTRVKKWKGFYQRKVDGKWQAATKILGRCADLSKKDAKAALANHIRGEGGAPVYRKGASFSEATERYLALKRGDWSSNMYATIAGLLRKHVVTRFAGKKRADEILPSDVKILFNAMASSESQLRKTVTHTRAVFDMLLEDDLITKNPAKSKTCTLPTVTKKPSNRWLTPEEVRALLSVAERRDYIILRVMFSCGLRPSEVVTLRLDDIENGRLRIDEAKVTRKAERSKDGRLQWLRAAVSGAGNRDTRIRHG
jgi:integrase